MKVVLVGDTHIPTRARNLPTRLLEALKRADAAVHTGDFVSSEVYRQFVEAVPVLHAVRGNCDFDPRLAQLPPYRLVELGGTRLAVIHGHQWGRPSPPSMARYFHGRADVVAYGHLHRPVVEQHGQILVLNPGSPTDPRGSQSSYLTVDWDESGGVHARVIYLDD